MDRNMNSDRPDTKATAASSEAGKGTGRRDQGGASKGTEVPVRSQPSQGDNEHYRVCKVCVDCELKHRTQQWDQRPAEVRAMIPDWATYQGVKRDLKMRNKGRMWNMAGQHIPRIKKRVSE